MKGQNLTECLKCGSLDPNPVHHPPYLYLLAKALGYRLYRCRGCGRLTIHRRTDSLGRLSRGYLGSEK